MKIGVFPYAGKTKVRYMAYTTWYDPNWRGCCEHYVQRGINGTAAKKLAIADHISNCGHGKDLKLLKAQGDKTASVKLR